LKPTRSKTISPAAGPSGAATPPSFIDGSVSRTSSMRLAATMARGMMMNTITSIMNPMTTCMA